MRKEREAIFETEIKGVKIKTTGKKIEFSSKFLKKLVNLFRNFHKTALKLRQIEKIYRERKDKIIKLIEPYQNTFRGIIVEKEFSISVFPREEIEWNREKLKEKLGSNYFNFVKEILTLKIPVREEAEKVKEEIEKVLQKVLKKEREEIKKLIEYKIEIEVDPSIEKKYASFDLEKIKKVKKSWVFRIL